MAKNEMYSSRRNFIKSGMTGLIGAVVAPSIIKKNKKYFNLQKRERKFVYRTLGKTGIKLPIVSMGTLNAPEMATAALDSGIVHIDTSSYARNGNDEIMLGKVLKNRPRDSYVITTSINMQSKFKTAALTKKNITAKVLRNGFEGSIKRLRLEYVDIYYLAAIRDKEIIGYAPYLETMKDIKNSGKARFVGITTHSNESEVIRAAADFGIYDVVLTAYNFKKNNRDEIKKAVKYAVDKGLGVVAMKTQAGVYWDKEKKRMINQKAALKWALQDENVHTAIPGFSNYEEMNELLSIMESLPLTPDEKADLSSGQGETATGLFCSQCRECLSQCPHDLDIPVLMRSYMYAYGYMNPSLARETLEIMNLAQMPCQNCDVCYVSCSMGFDVREKIVDIARIKDVPEEFLI